ncbi:winged helix-turn-helix domain-containing protein [Sphingomonas sp.]|uniref:winged helix-turn-helix domain-containing protein n=1 Tax=Sphingomonas sp. TaxID=28214 RepID=UPI001B077C32|nr:winged helix-turn-helix domain-containing protein [Sphingomonas sp.]MBO9713384.1 winged helix-turn-helix domain-containing protein [Sphingomonas sp.]
MLEKQEQNFGVDLPNPASDTLLQLRLADRESVTEARAVRFGRFTVYPGARLLLRDGEPVCIGGRAFDLLVILLRSRGQVVTKQEITRHVWPATFVEESNLRFQVGCLRRALGRDGHLIKSIAGRGYLLAADHRECEPVDPHGTFDDGPQDELLEGFLRTAAMLVSSYGSLDAFLGALAAHRR